MQGRLAFGPFLLDPAERLLLREGEPVELGGRYLDALLLLATEPGRLITKDRFHEQVWRGIPVTDEALTQCIRTLRRQLGDDAAAPRYIETVPRHGYRFVAPVERVERVEDAAEPLASSPPPALSPSAAIPVEARRRPAVPASAAGLHPLLLWLGGTVGGGVAGLLGGVVYGSLGASGPLSPGLSAGMAGGMGAASVLLVMMALTTLVGLAGGAGVSIGLAAAQTMKPSSRVWCVAGGAAGGLLIGGGAEVLGLDAFHLLIGMGPSDMTGAGEGALLGAGVGLGAGAALRRARTMPRAIGFAALCGGLAGTLVPLLGGRLLAGSLALLAQELPNSRLRPYPGGTLPPDGALGLASHVASAAFEGALFAGGVVGGMLLVQKWLAPPRPPA